MNATRARNYANLGNTRQRSLVALASLVITLAMFAGNLELARDYAQAAPNASTSAQNHAPVHA